MRPFGRQERWRWKTVRTNAPKSDGEKDALTFDSFSSPSTRPIGSLSYTLLRPERPSQLVYGSQGPQFHLGQLLRFMDVCPA